MTEMGVKKISGSEITLKGLNAIKPCASAETIEEITKGRHDVVDEEQQSQWARRRGHADKSYFFRARIFELDREDGKLMLRRQRAKHGQMAASGWVVMRYLVIENCNAQMKFPYEQLSAQTSRSLSTARMKLLT
jgi:hypothetical protein